jgi:type II secretory pathway component PulF
VFSETVVNLIRSGEVTGQLPDVLKEIVRSLKWQDEMATQTKKLLTYPAFVFVIIGGVVFFLMIYLVPQLIGFLKNLGQEIPLQTRLLIGLSGIFVNTGGLCCRCRRWCGLAILALISRVSGGALQAAPDATHHAGDWPCAQKNDHGAVCRHPGLDVPHWHSAD